MFVIIAGASFPSFSIFYLLTPAIMDFLEYPKALKEDRGGLVSFFGFFYHLALILTCAFFSILQTSGRLKLAETQIIFKNHKTGKIDTLNSNDFKKISWQRLGDSFGIRIMMKSGQVFRYGGFKESEKEKVEKFINSSYSTSLETQDASIRGWNWGTTSFEGSVLNFDVKKNERAFEIPLTNVSNTTTAKNEVTLEFHQNDDTSVSLMEMRFHIPTIDGIDPVQAFMEQVLQKANIIRETGECIAIFKELQCLTPRGRYDIKLFPTFIQLHGKTFDYKIPISSVLRLFQLPHKDTRSVYFVMSLDPPIKQGQTRYHFLILLFNRDEETTVELALSESEIKEKYEGKLSKSMSGPLYDTVTRLMRVLIQRKITTPDPTFVNSARDIPAVSCSYRASNGMMYPLERGFIYLHKPPVHIRFDEIQSINFARSGGSTRSFDFEIETKAGVVHTFSSIEKEEYSKLYDFVSTKGLRVKNVGTEGDKKKKSFKDDDLVDSDMDDDEPDAYLQRVREEGRVREELGDSDESDDDFNPGAEEEDVAEEFDSEVDDSSDSSGGGSDSEGEKKHKKKHKEKKVKKAKSSEKKKKKSSKDDDGKPKKPSTAYFIWMKEARDQIKKDNPGLGVTDIAKKAGELWKEVKDKAKYEELAAKERKNYEKLLSEWKANGGGASTSKASSSSSSSKSKAKKSSDSKKSSGSPTKSQSGFKSKEYIESDDSSSSSSSDEGDSQKKKKSKEKPKEKPKATKRKRSDSSDNDSDSSKGKGKGSESEEILSSPTASSASDSD